ncbi:MAG TPA: PHB depolymerase family esterase [Microthrixaceae bacterium]|nr:PHB depolymerase family esterase [Microthrixaceae bacterium]
MARGRQGATVLALAVAIALNAGCSGSGDDRADATDDTVVEPTSTVAASRPRPSPGCAKAEATPAVANDRLYLDVDGDERSYLVTAPAGRGAPMPLVLDIHGLAEGAEIHSVMTGYGELATEEGFVVAFPQAEGELLDWDADPRLDPNPDIAYINDLIDQLGEDFCLDLSRVYATGLSYGAIMSSLLACQMDDRIAAIVAMAGLATWGDCVPDRPVPMMAFHGTDDPIILFGGGVDLSGVLGGDDEPEAPSTTTSLPAPDLDGPGFPADVATWAERNGCDPTPTERELSPEVVERTYDCPDGTDVVSIVVLGGGHAWPGSEFSASIESIVGHTTFDVDATRDGWDFLKRHRLPS